MFAFIAHTAFGQNKNNPYPEFKPVSDQKQENATMDCELTRDKNNVLSTQYHKIFGHTHKELERYLVNEDLLEVFISISTIGEDYFLDVNYVFNTPKGVQSYGGFSKGSPVKVALLNGEKLFFNNIKVSRGKVNTKEGLSYFAASYMLDEYELKNLMEAPVMTWEVTFLYGTESYSVENINLIRQLLTCIESKKS